MKRSIYNYAFLAGGIFVLFLIYLIVQLAIGGIMFPSIESIGSEYISFLSLEKIGDLGLTLVRLIISVIAAFVISIVIGYLYFLFKPTYSFFKPLLYILKVSPIIAIIFYAQVLTASATLNAVYIVTILFLIPIMTEAYISGIDNIEDGVIEYLKLEPVNKTKQFFIIIFPSIAQNLILSFLQSIGLGLKVVIMVEFFCASIGGLGGHLQLYQTSVTPSGIIATILFVVTIVLILEIIIFILKKKVFNKA